MRMRNGQPNILPRSICSKHLLKVYNAMGMKVANLVDEKDIPGVMKYILDARLAKQGTNLPSGIYFYKLSIKQELFVVQCE